MADERAKKIKLMLFDVDGVMTDGTIFFFPAPAGGAGSGTHERREQMADQGGFGIASHEVIEAKGFNAHDGTGFSLARLGGLKTGIITKRISETVALRARDLKLDYVYQGQQEKPRRSTKSSRRRACSRNKCATSGTISSICR